MHRFAFALTALLAFSALACHDERNADLDNSHDRWDELRTELHGNYDYRRSFSSWVGYRETTRISVRNGVVTQRAHRTLDPDGKEVVSYTETGTDLGSHTAGFPARTVDQLYTECETDVLTKDDEDNEIRLLFDARGILKTCTYRPYNCADDCVWGIDLTFEAPIQD